MKKHNYYLFIFILLLFRTNLIASTGELPSTTLEEVWHEFRQIHPYGFQTVALKHIDNACVFIISEPTEAITERELNDLFCQHGGNMIVKHQPLGYDGWLADVVGSVRFKDDNDFNSFTHELFTLLYGTDYKAYYTNLDTPSEHVYFSEYRLNYSVSAAELFKWFVTDKEEFMTDSGTSKTIKSILSSKSTSTNELYYSKNHGFVAWVITPDRITNTDKTFKTNARRFALDSDIIIGAFGNIGKKMAIIARERVIPVNILPPLRIETLTLLATTQNDNLAQSFELYNVFAGKTSEGKDMGPIYLSDELWHTEYGNLLNMTDQMLKSWTENDYVHDYNYNYPTPVDWAFNNGVFRDLSLSNTLTYNWNTAGAGYVIQDMGGVDVYAVNRTGSLPVSFIPEGMEGKVDERVNEAEELAYDFFSELDSPELAREVQYATIYQIFRYFRTPKNLNETKNTKHIDRDAPSFTIYENIITDLLKVVEDTSSIAFRESYQAGLLRFEKKYNKVNTHTRLRELLENDPYGEFGDFIDPLINIDSILNSEPSREEIKYYFDLYLFSNIDSINKYISEYKKRYGAFPFSEAAHYFVNGRNVVAKDIEPEGSEELDKDIIAYNDSVKIYNYLNEAYIARVESYNRSLFITPSSTLESWSKELDEEEKALNKKYEWLLTQEKIIEAKRKVIDKQREQNLKEYQRQLYLRPNVNHERALGAINWLLTDPEQFDSPIGPYYASKFTSHRQWIRSSSVTCSNNEHNLMYGGHNLDARITPIKLASKAPKTGANIPKDYCCVTLKNGNKIITVAEVDKARVTPKVLRTIERKAVGSETGELLRLPKAPQERPKIAFIGKGSANELRGFDKVKHSSTVPKKQAFINGKEVKSTSELRDVIVNDITKKGTSSVKEIHFKNYTPREVHVYADNLKECVIERSYNDGINLANFKDDIKVVNQGDGTIKMIFEQRPETLPDNGAWKSGKLEITIPGQDIENAEKAIKKVYSLPEQQINNKFKMTRQLKLELQEVDPGFDYYDIKCEHSLFGHIYIEYENEILVTLAA